MKFEVGKFYRHTGGGHLHIIAKAPKTIMWFGPVLIAETPEGDLRPCGADEASAVNWNEITEVAFRSLLETEDITHYGLFRKDVPTSPMVKEADFFREQGGLEQPWGSNWEPIYRATSIGDARRKFAHRHGITLSHIYDGEE